jgi:hypothetical protein
MQVLNQPQKFERRPFWGGWSYEIKNNGTQDNFNGMTSLLNFMKTYQMVQ